MKHLLRFRVCVTQSAATFLQCGRVQCKGLFCSICPFLSPALFIVQQLPGLSSCACGRTFTKGSVSE